jgi:hypothetical protein
MILADVGSLWAMLVTLRMRRWQGWRVRHEAGAYAAREQDTV